MLAQVFNPTEIKNNGPATTPASAPARRAAFLFTAGWVVLSGTAQSYCDPNASQSMPVESVVPTSRDEERLRGQPALVRSASDWGR
jgi:hypothetical protein